VTNGEFQEKLYTGKAAYTERELPDYSENEKVKRARRGKMDLPFLLITLILLTIGVVMVLSASFARAYYAYNDPTKYFVNQIIFAVSGIAIMLAASRFTVNFYKKIAMPLLGFSIIMLIAVLIIGVGEEETGARRWIDLGVTTFQPSEIVKVSVILAFATMICVYRDKMKTFKYGILPFAGILLVIIFLLVKEPHLSASIIILAIGAIMMFAGGTHWGWFAGAAGIGTVGVIAVVRYVKGVMEQGAEAVEKMGYAFSRIVAWIDPFYSADDTGWQTIQSLYAIGSGGVTGLGIGQGRQKYLYLPEEHNDFIFSVVCEELGFIGALLVIILFALLVIRGFWLALHTRDRFGALVITGITSLIAIQVFLNIAVVTNLLPCTGVSLPFFSYGGTALWIQLAEVGIVLSISRDIPLKKSDDGVEK